MSARVVRMYGNKFFKDGLRLVKPFLAHVEVAYGAQGVRRIRRDAQRLPVLLLCLWNLLLSFKQCACGKVRFWIGWIERLRLLKSCNCFIGLAVFKKLAQRHPRALLAPCGI